MKLCKKNNRMSSYDTVDDYVVVKLERDGVIFANNWKYNLSRIDGNDAVAVETQNDREKTPKNVSFAAKAIGRTRMSPPRHLI